MMEREIFIFLYCLMWIWLLFFHVNEEKRINEASIFVFVAFLLFGNPIKMRNSRKYISSTLILASVKFKICDICIAIVLDSR